MRFKTDESVAREPFPGVLSAAKQEPPLATR